MDIFISDFPEWLSWFVLAGWIGAAIGAGAALLGGAMSNKSADKRADRAADQNAAIQKEFAQHGIRWKVKDAKAAGLHPLYAIGASPTQASPIALGGGGDATDWSGIGRNAGDAISSFFAESGQQNSRSALSDEQKLEQQLRISELSARVKKDDAIAAYYASLAGTERQKQAWGSIPSSTGSPSIGAVQFKPDEVVSADPQNPSLVAGKHPAMTRYNIGGGNIELPYSSEGPAESLENPALFPFIAGYNAMRMVPESVWDRIVEARKTSFNRRTPPVRPTTQSRYRSQWSERR